MRLNLEFCSQTGVRPSFQPLLGPIQEQFSDQEAVWRLASGVWRLASKRDFAIVNNGFIKRMFLGEKERRAAKKSLELVGTLVIGLQTALFCLYFAPKILI